MTVSSNSDDFPSIPSSLPIPHSPAPLAPPSGAPTGPPLSPHRPPAQPTGSPSEPPPGYTAHRPGHPAASTPDKQGNWIGAIAAAIGIQIAAAVVLGLGAVIAIVAALAGFGDSSSDTSWFVLLVLPVALIALALYVASGLVASKIARDGRGWLMLIVGPVMLVSLSLVLGALGR